MSWLPEVTDEMSIFPTDEDYGYEAESDTDAQDHGTASMDSQEEKAGSRSYLHLRDFDKAEDVLNADNFNVDTELIFNSVNEAFSWRTRQRAFNPQTAADPTIPRNIRQKKAAVKLVFKAYKSVALATDNAGMLRAFVEQKHDNRQVETVCWSVVEGCIDRCHRGPLLTAYEPAKAKNNPSIRTFAERLDAVVESLSHQKTICKHLLDAPYLNRFLDDPVGSKQRVESNRKLNKRKGGVMDVGKKALGISDKKDQSSDRKSTTISDAGDNDDRYVDRGNSSSVSAPFNASQGQTLPSNVYGMPLDIGRNPFLTSNLMPDENLAPPSRIRGRGMSTNFTMSPQEFGTLQPSQVHRHRQFDGSTLAGGNRSAAHLMGMISESTLGSAPAAYVAHYPHATASAASVMMPLQDQNSAHLSHQVNKYQGAYPKIGYGSNTTSSPLQISNHFTKGDTDGAFMPSPDSDENNGSDSEYLPNAIRPKKRRQR